ncbi:MAG TPA: hypothetical protein PL045_11825 [Chitinophagaceae bacterium]|nr:hypothetical protein [Chitinophagaceae bacterium]
MPKIHDESEMFAMFESINSGMKVKDVSFMMNKTPYEINRLYNAALRRTWPHYQRRMNNAITRTKHKVYFRQPQKNNERPKAEYSNASPYRIASEGILK